MIYKILNVNLDYSKLNCKKTEYQPTLHAYIANETEEMSRFIKKRPTMLILPGGAYSRTSDREAEPIALYYLSKGYNCFILRYSCCPAHFPIQLAEAGKSVLMIKENAEAWRVDTDKIFVCGFSAGGHLAASLGVFWDKPFLSEILGVKNEALKFNSLILSYPVISNNVDRKLSGSIRSFENLLGEKLNDKEYAAMQNLESQVSENTPPCFIWHTYEDKSVPVETTLMFAMALRKYNIPMELHIYEHGNHGRSTSTKVCCECDERSKAWMDISYEWLEEKHGIQ